MYKFNNRETFIQMKLIFFKSSLKWFENCPVGATKKKASEKSGAFF